MGGFSTPSGAGAPVPTGTGFTHITTGAQDAAAKLVVDADVNAAAAIAASKISGLYAGFTVQTDVRASRAINGTVYQNTSGKPMMVVITVEASATIVTASLNIKTDASNPPTTTVAVMSSNNISTFAHVNNMSSTFIVLPGNYYNATEISSGSSYIYLGSWIEWT